MWVKVNTEFLDDLSAALYREAQILEEGSREMHEYTQNASATLEGRQYSLSVSKTKQVCDAVYETTVNMRNLAVYLSNLSDHIQDYLNCTYNGG